MHPLQDQTDSENSENERETQALEHVVSDFINEHITEEDISEIPACHVLPTPKKENKPGQSQIRRNIPLSIIVRFVSRRTKDRVVKNASGLRDYNRDKGIKVGINEHLTKKNSDIYKHARDLKKKKLIFNTYTRNCKVLIRTLGDTAEERRPYHIKNMADFTKYRLPIPQTPSKNPTKK